MTTTIKPTLEAEVEGLGKIYRVNRPFNEALESLNEQKAKIISSRDLAYARTKKPNGSLCNNGSYTREGFLHSKNEPYLLALDSPLLDLELADYFSTDKEVYNKYREKAEEDKSKSPNGRGVIILSGGENYKIPTNRFNEDELTLFLFKDQAENYGNFLKENGIDKMPVWLVDRNYVDSEERVILTQLWLHPLDGRSCVYGDSNDFDCYYGVRGLLKKTNEVMKNKEI